MGFLHLPKSTLSIPSLVPSGKVYTTTTTTTTTPCLSSSALPFSLNHGISLLLADNDSYYYSAASTGEFEPVVNTPALFAFSLIAVVYTLLFIRIKGIESAANERSATLERLRQMKSMQLDDNSGNINNVSEELVQTATEAYRNALEKELSLRSILPGVRIAAPNDPKKMEEEISAAKQFLNMDLTTMTDSSDNNDYDTGVESPNEEDEELMRRKSLLTQSRRRMDGKIETEKTTSNEVTKDDVAPMSNGSKAVLILVAITQIVLFCFLSLDPMTANNFLSALDPIESISSIQ